MKRQKIFLFIIVSILLVLFFNFTLTSCGLNKETKEYITNLRVIKQEFLNKSSEAIGIDSEDINQRLSDLKAIKLKLIALGNPDNKKLRKAQELCLKAMDCDISAVFNYGSLQEGLKNGRLTSEQQKRWRDMSFNDSAKGYGFFSDVDNILKEF